MSTKYTIIPNIVKYNIKMDDDAIIKETSYPTVPNDYSMIDEYMNKVNTANKLARQSYTLIQEAIGMITEKHIGKMIITEDDITTEWSE